MVGRRARGPRPAIRPRLFLSSCDHSVRLSLADRGCGCHEIVNMAGLGSGSQTLGTAVDCPLSQSCFGNPPLRAGDVFVTRLLSTQNVAALLALAPKSQVLRWPGSQRRFSCRLLCTACDLGCLLIHTAVQLLPHYVGFDAPRLSGFLFALDYIIDTLEGSRVGLGLRTCFSLVQAVSPLRHCPFCLA